MKKYKPTELDEYVRLEDGQYQKLIWGKPSTLMKKDENKWLAFKAHIVKSKLPMPHARYMDEETRVGYRYMQSCYWFFDETYAAMIQNAKWHVQTFPINESAIKSMMNEGLIYVAGRCKPGH